MGSITLLFMWRIKGQLDDDTKDLVVCRGVRRPPELTAEDRESAAAEAGRIVAGKVSRRERPRHCQAP